MNCPHCNTPNDPSNQFCMSCGKPMKADATLAANRPAVSPSEWLGILTIRLVAALFGLWILNKILTQLSFVKELKIPDFDVTPASIISAVLFLVMILLLLGFARLLGVLWPRTFPKAPEAVLIWNAIIYLIVLSVGYTALRPVIQGFFDEPEVLMVFQIVLVVIALLIVIRPSIVIYKALPTWLVHLRDSLSSYQMQPPAQ